MLNFTYTCRHTTYTDTIATHDSIFSLTILVKICKPHRLRILCSKLEDITYFDTSLNSNCLLTTAWADTTFYNLSSIYIFYSTIISLDIKSCYVVICLISTSYKVIKALKRAIKEYCNILWKALWSNKSSYNTTFLCNYSWVNIFTYKLRKLSFINIKITSDKYNNVRIISILLIYNSLTCLCYRHLKEVSNFFNCLLIWCMNLSHISHRNYIFIFNNTISSFHISSVITLSTDSD